MIGSGLKLLQVSSQTVQMVIGQDSGWPEYFPSQSLGHDWKLEGKLKFPLLSDGQLYQPDLPGPVR